MSDYFLIPTGGKSYSTPLGTNTKIDSTVQTVPQQKSIADNARKDMSSQIAKYGLNKTTVTIRRYGIK
jgi:hypothetical protein